MFFENSEKSIKRVYRLIFFEKSEKSINKRVQADFLKTLKKV